MASEGEDMKVPATASPVTDTIAPDNEYTNMKRTEQNEESSSATTTTTTTTTTEAAAAMTTITTTQAKTTTDPASTDNWTVSKTMATTEELEHVPAAATATTVQHNTSTTNGTASIPPDDRNSKKRKALDNNKESAAVTATGTAAVTTLTTATPANYNANVDNSVRTENLVDQRDVETPPTKIWESGRPRKQRRRPGRPRNVIHDNNNNRANENKIVYYAIRPGMGPAPIENPIIFFGFKEFDFFHKCCFNQTLIEYNGGTAPSFSFRIYDTLAEALAYVGADTENNGPALVGRRTCIGGSTSGASSTAQRQPNHHPSPSQAAQPQIPALTQQPVLTTPVAAAAHTAQGHEQQQMTMRQHQMMMSQAQQRYVFAAPVVATKATQQQTVRRQQQIVRVQTVAAPATVQTINPATATTTKAPNNPAGGQPTNNIAVTPPPTATTARNSMNIPSPPVTIGYNSRWEEHFELLRQYKQEHGNCDVRLLGTAGRDCREKYKSLQPWTNAQRENLKFCFQYPTSPMPRLTPDQRKRLMDLGFIMDVEDFRWKQKFELLREYKEEHGDCDIFKATEQELLGEKYKPLVYWGKKQQQMIKDFDDNINASQPTSALAAERRKLLVDLGLPILQTERERFEALQVSYDRFFQKRLGELKAYKEEHGNCDIRLSSDSEPKYKTLASWVSAQREQLKLFLKDPNDPKIKLTPYQRDQLMDLGFVINAEEFRWYQKFELLKEYKEEYGDCNIFKTKNEQPLTEKYQPLINWGRRQQQLIKMCDNNGHPSFTERRNRLVDLGLPPNITFTPEANFDKAFQKKIEELKAYKEEHGTIVLPTGSGLRQWISNRRREYAALQDGKPSPLKLEHVVALTSLGFAMTGDHVPRKKMKERVAEYVEFVNKHGRFPDNRSKDPAESVLGGAAQKWRQRRKLHAKGVTHRPRIGKTEIPQDLIDALDSVNFKWEVRGFELPKAKSRIVPWNDKYELLKKYKEKHGHCEPPKRHPKLGMFVFDCRRHYKFMVENKKSNLTVERFRKLSEIGFRFKTAAVAGIENKRKRFVDNGSSGYDTTSEEEEEEDDEGDENDNDDNENDNTDNDNHHHHQRSADEQGDRRNIDRSSHGGGNDDQRTSGTAPYQNSRNRQHQQQQWIPPDNFMWG